MDFINEDSDAIIDPTSEETISDLACLPLVELASRLERPLSPDQDPVPVELATSNIPGPHDPYDYWNDEDDAWPALDLPSVSKPKSLQHPPIFDLASIRVIYFDIYGTLIDKEAGVYDALQPLLGRSTYNFNRREALSFYFESEMEMKRLNPEARYSQMLADTYEDVALRLGTTPETIAESAVFAQSIKDWPLIHGADWCLYQLTRIPSLSIVALTDVDHGCLEQTTAFSTIAPFLEVVFTWDACSAYKPDLTVFDAPLKYYDAMSVPRAHSCLVSSSLLGDLEPARDMGLPTVWMRYPGSLPGGMDKTEYACPVAAFDSLFVLAAQILDATGTPLVWEIPFKVWTPADFVVAQQFLTS
ncbi:HAD-like domain-containing protein [Mycena vulgaris]|nr:HAD-like domain-containing protein [Mycena vulgaris]